MPVAVRWTEPGEDPTPTKALSSLVADWGIVGIEDDGYVLEALLVSDVDVDDEDSAEEAIAESWCPVPDSMEIRYVMRSYSIPRISANGDDDDEDDEG